jgi:hypothetical protein
MKKIIIENLKGLSANKIVNPQRARIAKEKRIWRNKNPF